MDIFEYLSGNIVFLILAIIVIIIYIINRMRGNKMHGK